MIKVLLADDHALVRQGLRAMLESVKDIDVVGEAGEGRAAVALVEKLSPHIVLMDISMPGLDGLEATRLIAARFPQTRVIMLSMHTTEEHLSRALQVGARGYILKQGVRADVLMAIHAVHRGEMYIDPSLSQRMIDNYLKRDEQQTPLALLTNLTAREREVLRLIAEGLSSQEVAEKLVISPKTVDRHRANLMGKLNIHNTAGLVRFAIQAGVLPLDE